MDEHKTHTLDIVKDLGTDLTKGLSDSEAADSRKRYGLNELSKPPRKSLLMRIFESLKEPMLMILIISTIVTIIVNVIKYFNGKETEFIESAGILVAIMLSVVISVIMEGRSEKAFDALNKISENVVVKVIREGKLVLLPLHEIVVGDLIQLETGDKIPADGRLVESSSLSIDESALTGESKPAKKNADKVFQEGKIPLAERINMAYSGCYVTAGKGSMIVTAVGDETEFGKIAKELSEVEGAMTPLQEKLQVLGKRITTLGTTAAAAIFIVQIMQLIANNTINVSNVGEVFITSIVLIVAAVPEGLPTIVVIALALNVIKMARQNALVKKMVACETVGAINVICSDKTGTLTENKMTATEIHTLSGMLKPNEIRDRHIVTNFAVNATANIQQNNDKTYQFIGSPTECALLVALEKSGVHYSKFRKSSQIVHTYPFSSESKKMTTIIKFNRINIAYSKGSPEKILEMCALDSAMKYKIAKQIEEFEKQAKRIIAFAHIDNVPSGDYDKIRNMIERDMIFDGFVVITDPIRADVFDAVNRCRNAGIAVKMLTGDNIVTARAIAMELGLAKEESQVFHADDIESMSDEELYRKIDKISVIARSTPSTKLRVVNMLKQKGNVVAVTGDGVNDAPAIKNADVGIAMGITGTEVSKEASDIVLLDDSFTTIVRAVHWGRGIYENFQRFIQFQLTVNFSAVIVVIVCVLLGKQSPFNTLQLLWINIIMDGPPALTLGLEPIREEMMKRRPIKRDSSIVTRDMMVRIAVIGIYITIIFFWQAFGNLLRSPAKESQTILFTLFVMFQLFNAFNSRELGTKSILKNIGHNKMMLFVFFLTFSLQVLITQFGGAVFDTVPLPPIMWLKITLLSFSVILISELYKLVRKHVVL